MTTIKQLLQFGKQCLTPSSDTASIDSEVLLCHVLSCSRTHLYSHADSPVDNQAERRFKQLIDARKTGYPVAYLTERQPFWTLNLAVNQHTLIPRPETELLVEFALEQLQSTQAPNILDLGTGSGAIALAIASERPDANIYAVDISFDALQVAQKNQKHHHCHNVKFVCSHWLKAISPTPYFDMILSNPPYIANNDRHLSTDIRYEPTQALSSGPQGLDAICEIVAEAKSRLKTQGWLVIEHGYAQKDPVLNLLNAQDFCQVHCQQDLNHLDRLSAGQKG